MERRVAKELLHIRDWLSLADDIVRRGRDAYSADGLLQEAGDSLMMKLGEAAGRLARAEVEPPAGMVRSRGRKYGQAASARRRAWRSTTRTGSGAWTSARRAVTN